MIKDKTKRGVFDALLIKALGIDYIKFVISLSGSCKIPEGFPKEYGIRLYNEGIPAKVFEDMPPGLFSAEELVQIKGDFESCLSIFREMTDRAIAGQRPTKEDIGILEEILLKDKKLRIESYSKEKAYFYPSMYVNIPTGRALALSWVYWVWIKDIKAKKCKAKDCHRIFIPVRSDQEYCFKRCAKRVWAQRNILER
ncbi:hypothetical protein ES695_06910 [Candidatus Atribacteria bacterium 1244-E10-H5-B2]|nr:MAG: hypothetical protein ES695_06910 [Candidatus Atribacteria bacterium 1244-E10-H5-B2]